jgi:hypothetical protein
MNKVKCKGCKRLLEIDEIEAKEFSANVYNILIDGDKITYEFSDYEDELDFQYFCKHCGKELASNEDEFKELLGLKEVIKKF